MNHPGLSDFWGFSILLAMIVLSARFLTNPSFDRLSVVSPAAQKILTWPDSVARSVTNKTLLIILKILFVAVFLLIIAAGLFGTSLPERNIATVATWTYWWTGIIISVFFLGSAWCAVCPWDTLATWLTRRKIWGRGTDSTSLNIRVPRALQKIWPATVLFVFLTWLELGVGITVNPYATAVLSLAMVVMATASLAIYERKAFCNYICPVGRTIGTYSQMAPVAVGPVDQETCASCKTLDCYNGSETVEPCPTHLVIGKSRQSAYCTSCGACTQSCPHHNVSWRIYQLGKGVLSDIRIRPDEAWFILVLLTLTMFHGLTMLPVWENSVRYLARLVNDTGQLLTSFSIMLAVAIIIPVIFYGGAVSILRRSLGLKFAFKNLFSDYAFALLPLAFSYHIAHNLSHLFREGKGIAAILLNPLGLNTLPMSMAEKHARHMALVMPEPVLFMLQAAVMIFGFWLSLKVIVQRTRYLDKQTGAVRIWQLLPIFIFVFLINSVNIWLLMQPMAMRL